MIKCIIVDDEPLAMQIMEDHIRKTLELKLVKKCANALEAFDIIHKEHVDLIFLDIQMPSLSGIDFIKSLKNPPAVIFTTVFSEHAALSYELNAIDYFLKPITYQRFSAGIAKFLKLQLKPEPEPVYSYFKVNGKLVKIGHADIIYAQSVKDYIIIRTAKESYITHMTMKYLVELLPKSLFRRVHRSFMIGISHITSIGRHMIELGDIKIPVGENYKIDILGKNS